MAGPLRYSARYHRADVSASEAGSAQVQLLLLAIQHERPQMARELPVVARPNRAEPSSPKAALRPEAEFRRVARGEAQVIAVISPKGSTYAGQSKPATSCGRRG